MTAENTATPAAPDTIVLIRGLWMTPLSWEHWIDRYEARGFRVLAPAGPWMDGDIDELRRDPSGIEHLGIREVIDHYAAIVRELDRPPIIMGHSFGGAFTQILLARGLGAAGVAIESAAVKGVPTLPWSTLKTAFPGLKRPANNRRAVALSLEEFRCAFANMPSEEESRAAYERYAVSGPGRVLFQAALANFNPRASTSVDFHNDRVPLLFIAGGKDHVSPAALNESNARRYLDSKALTVYEEFPLRSRFTLLEEGWELVADYTLTWAIENAAVRRQPATT
jgi:pimeloyl-ACP methyl ester carboxylesterase